eukprot:m.152872 g.152872  ORF g.152872 m.152872 type:complete len:301 (-) comp16924_c2_seq4:1775-2677(-)
MLRGSTTRSELLQEVKIIKQLAKENQKIYNHSRRLYIISPNTVNKLSNAKAPRLTYPSSASRSCCTLQLMCGGVDIDTYTAGAGAEAEAEEAEALAALFTSPPSADTTPMSSLAGGGGGVSSCTNGPSRSAMRAARSAAVSMFAAEVKASTSSLAGATTWRCMLYATRRAAHALLERSHARSSAVRVSVSSARRRPNSAGGRRRDATVRSRWAKCCTFRAQSLALAEKRKPLSEQLSRLQGAYIHSKSARRGPPLPPGLPTARSSTMPTSSSSTFKRTSRSVSVLVSGSTRSSVTHTSSP